MKNKAITLFTVLIMFLCLTWLKISDFLFFNEYLGRLGHNYLYLIISLIIIFFASRLGKVEDFPFNIKALKSTFIGSIFVIPFYLLGLLLEYLYSLREDPLTKIVFMPEDFRISPLGGYNLIILRIILIIIFTLILVIVEEGYFRFLFLRKLNKDFSFPTSAITISILYGLWFLLNYVRDYAAILRREPVEIALYFSIGFLLSLKWAMEINHFDSFWIAFGDHLSHQLLFNFFHVIGKNSMDKSIHIRFLTLAIVPIIFIIIRDVIIKKSLKKNMGKTINQN